MPFNSLPLNTDPLNAGAIPLAVSPGGDQLSTTFIYRLEARSLSGVLLSYQRNWHTGIHLIELGRMSILTFTIPAEDVNAGDYVVPNQAWLYDNSNNLIDKFHIVLRNPRRVPGGGLTIDIEARSLLYQLGEEYVSDLDVGDGATDTIENIVRSLLENHQVLPKPIRYGTIDPLIGDELRHFHFQGMTIMACLNRIRDTIGGYINITPNRRLHWHRNVGEAKGQQIRYRKNEKGISKSEDRSTLVTRAWAEGAGTTQETRIRPPAPFYIDGDTQGTYGIIARQFHDNTIFDQDALVEAATAWLKDRQYPLTSYEIDMVALEYDQSFGSTFDKLEIGSQVTVLDEVLGIDLATRVIRIERSLDNPLDVRVQVANPDAGTSEWGTAAAAVERMLTPTSSRMYADLLRRLDALERADHGLYRELGISGPEKIVTLDGAPIGTDFGTEDLGSLAFGAGLPMSDGSQIATWDSAGNFGTLLGMIQDMIDDGIFPAPVNEWVPFTS